MTEDEIRRITRIAADVAKASAIAKKVDVKLAPVPAYTEYWSSPMKKDPTSVPADEKQAFVQKVVDAVVKNKFSQDELNPQADKGPAANDRRHQLVVTFNWNVPGDIQFAGLASARSGLPWNVTTGVDNNLDTQTTNDRPDLAVPGGDPLDKARTRSNTTRFAYPSDPVTRVASRRPSNRSRRTQLTSGCRGLLRSSSVLRSSV